MTDDQKRISNIFMLSLVIWREARGEDILARTGVACSILNRVYRPAWWGDDILSVVTKKWQYSSMTDPKDRQLTRWPISSDPAWWACMDIAINAFNGKVVNPVPAADSYHDISIPAPAWATPDIFVAQLGRLRFYNVDRDVEI